jgi:hypothetical protein
VGKDKAAVKNLWNSEIRRHLLLEETKTLKGLVLIVETIGKPNFWFLKDDLVKHLRKFLVKGPRIFDVHVIIIDPLTLFTRRSSSFSTRKLNLPLYEHFLPLY